MGVDTVVIAEHDLKNFEIVPGLLKCCDELFLKHAGVLRRYVPSEWNPIKKILIKYNKSSLEWNWINTPVDKINTEIDGPFGFSLWFDGIKLYAIHPPPRWAWFIGESDIQEAVTEITECIAKALGGHKVIYVPDSYYCTSFAADEYIEKETIEDVEKCLLTKCGKPAKNLKSIRKNYIDEEMYKYFPDWDGSEDSRGYEVDGYYVFNLDN